MACYNINFTFTSTFRYEQFLGAFAKERKASIAFVMSVRPHEKFGSHSTDFGEI